MRVFNFSAGPATLPEEVLTQAAAELLDWRGSGMSVMEMSHRGREFISIAAQAEADLRELLAIPANYKVLFLQGGALAQNAIVPMNLLRGKSKADYIDTGDWSKKSIKEAQKYCTVNIAASGKDSGFTAIPPQSAWQLSADSAYVHICTNETIGGLEYQWTPDTGDLPLVADMSSHILSRPLDVSKFGCIYAGAQKNMGIAGLTVVIVRDDLIGQALPTTPWVFDYQAQSEAESMYNTPSTYPIYMAGLVFQWLKRGGGLAAMEQRNLTKAKTLYDVIDASSLYVNKVAKRDRSRMNVVFTLKDDKLDAPFLKATEAAGMAQLKGHRSVGGMRASIYNAMPQAGVDALADLMRDFERRHG